MKSTLYRLFRTNDDPALLIARVALGGVLFAHGAQKMLGWFGGYGFAGTMQFFTGTLHIPAFFAFLAILTEFFGALALVAGLLARPAALAVIVLMAVAVGTSHLNNGFYMNWAGSQKGEGFEYHLLAVGLALVTALRGAGALSVDALIARRLTGERTDTIASVGAPALS